MSLFALVTHGSNHILSYSVQTAETEGQYLQLVKPYLQVKAHNLFLHSQVLSVKFGSYVILLVLHKLYLLIHRENHVLITG